MAEHGHGHESAGHGHESAEHGGGKHGEWMKHAVNGLAGLGITLGIAKFGVGLLQAASVVLAPYMGWVGIGAGLWYLWKQEGGGKKAAHAEHGGHH